VRLKASVLRHHRWTHDHDTTNDSDGGYRGGGYCEIAALRRSYAFGDERGIPEISDPELLTPLASDCAMVDR
jgi:hypothetical protein